MGAERRKVDRVHMTDIESIQLDDQCGMKFWWAKLDGGRGLVRREDALKDQLGLEIHEDLYTISQMEDISPKAIQEALDDILSPLTAEDRQNRKRMELLYRRLGWIAAFALYIEPSLRRAYDPVLKEGKPPDRELIFEHDPLWVVVKPDRLLMDKATNEVLYHEYLPSTNTGRQWLHSHHYKVRLHAGLAALQNDLIDTDLGKREMFGQVRALSLGFESSTDGHLVHPYVYGYHSKAKQEWTCSSALSARGNGVWDVAPIWTFPGGIVSWVQACGEEIAKAQFPLSPKVKLNEYALNEWAARRIHRERTIASLRTTAQENHYLRKIHFEKRTDHCYPEQGPPCPFLKLCWDKKLAEGPISSGLFVQNVPNLHMVTEGLTS